MQPPESSAATISYEADSSGRVYEKEAMRATTPRSAGRAKVLNVVVADVRRSE